MSEARGAAEVRVGKKPPTNPGLAAPEEPRQRQARRPARLAWQPKPRSGTAVPGTRRLRAGAPHGQHPGVRYVSPQRLAPPAALGRAPGTPGERLGQPHRAPHSPTAKLPGLPQGSDLRAAAAKKKK